MKIPQFLFEQFVDNTIFNDAMVELQSSIRETGSDNVFLIPGVINPAALLFSFNSNLVVTVNAQNQNTLPLTAFKCLFVTGAITDAHGIIDGADTSTYTVDLSSLVPIAGSVTAYIVATYTTVQEDQTTIIGAPPGHPDYSANFVPYIGYNTIQDTLAVSATTTAPDNQTTIELARLTLVSGQTIVNSVDTSNQVLASVNSRQLTLAGDVVGASNSNQIASIQTDPVNVSGRATGNVLTWNGTAWAPNAPATSLPPSGAAGGDLSGTYPNPTVSKSSAATFLSNNISATGSISATGNVTTGGNALVTGFVQGANAALTNQAVMLGQLSAAFNSISLGSITTSGNIYKNYFTIPIYNTNTGHIVSIYVQWGFYSFYGMAAGNVANNPFTVTYQHVFPTGPLFASATFATNNLSGTGYGAFTNAGAAMETSSLGLSTTTFYVDQIAGSIGAIHIANASTQGLLGFWWMIIGS